MRFADVVTCAYYMIHFDGEMHLFVYTTDLSILQLLNVWVVPNLERSGIMLL